ncbi:polysaccharide biosynthesis tyrosine autokinase [Deinococcus petrolearius]|uniref:AAA family ATPase n=1 Tax=Deinococcus petrolearius TaxID=1751295 RepID=A0ABW1DHH6_9DEIO
MTAFPTDDLHEVPKSRAPQPPVPEGGNEENEIELGALWQGVRRGLPWILLTAALVGGGTYLWSRAQPSVYTASSSLVTSGNGNVGGTSLVTAAPLPPGALQEALQGPVVLGNIIKQVQRAPQFSAAQRSEVSADLQQELQRQELTTIELQARLDQGGNGVYVVSARGPSPKASAALTDIATDALLSWDRSRALSVIQRAQASLRAQVASINTQLAAGNLTDIERQTLITARAGVQRSLAEAGIQVVGLAGYLQKVAPAVAPLDRVSPRPTRNAILAGLLTLLLGVGLAALRTVTDRSVRSEEDLLNFGLPTLGVIPRLRKRDIVMSGIVRAARQAGLYEAIGFLRVNLLSQLPRKAGLRVLVTSTSPGEGKSSLTATLADSFAASGQRVLIIDADLRRGTQQEVWDKFQREYRWVQLAGQEGGARSLQDALRQPGNVQVMEVEPQVHVLPSGPGLHDSLPLLNQADLGGILPQWSRGYDLVLIDSPPLLALADSLVLGRHTDGVLIVTEEGKTSLQTVRQLLRRANQGGLPILGFVLNKVAVSSRGNQNYGYSYEPRRAGQR